MRLQRKVVFLAALVLVAAVTAFAALRGQSRHNQPPKKQHSGESPADTEVPTLVQEGVMSARQRQHGKLYKGNRYPAGRRISELVGKRNDLVIWGPISEVPRRNLTLRQSLTHLKCEADAVVLAAVKSKSSNLTEGGTFIFTDYEATVEDVLKSSPHALVDKGSDITVTRPGGAISLKGHVVRAIDNEVARLEVGRRYLLYLKIVPGTGTYGQVGHPLFADAFLMHEDEVKQISDKPLPLGWKRTADAVSYLSEARNVLNNPCMGATGE